MQLIMDDGGLAHVCNIVFSQREDYNGFVKVYAMQG